MWMGVLLRAFDPAPIPVRLLLPTETGRRGCSARTAVAPSADRCAPGSPAREQFWRKVDQDAPIEHCAGVQSPFPAPPQQPLQPYDLLDEGIVSAHEHHPAGSGPSAPGLVRGRSQCRLPVSSWNCLPPWCGRSGPISIGFAGWTRTGPIPDDVATPTSVRCLWQSRRGRLLDPGEGNRLPRPFPHDLHLSEGGGSRTGQARCSAPSCAVTGVVSSPLGPRRG